jgi:hypothetical protein
MDIKIVIPRMTINDDKINDRKIKKTFCGRTFDLFRNGSLRRMNAKIKTTISETQG